jgi:hypothetical protein
MGQPALRALLLRTDPVAQAPRTELAEWRAVLAWRLLEPAGILSGKVAEDEADHCLARAEAEVRRAGETTHPAARDAHLQMAILYRQRAIAARQAQANEIRSRAIDGRSIS